VLQKKISPTLQKKLKKKGFTSLWVLEVDMAYTTTELLSWNKRLKVSQAKDWQHFFDLLGTVTLLAVDTKKFSPVTSVIDMLFYNPYKIIKKICYAGYCIRKRSYGKNKRLI
jgi:alkanesulfonate monooxygenase SsuD/methylene tetrahydromethanopterin reductase-like flavin-dependent oxidoreductase (luciferase family)